MTDRIVFNDALSSRTATTLFIALILKCGDDLNKTTLAL